MNTLTKTTKGDNNQSEQTQKTADEEHGPRQNQM